MHYHELSKTVVYRKKFIVLSFLLINTFTSVYGILLVQTKMYTCHFLIHLDFYLGLPCEVELSFFTFENG